MEVSNVDVGRRIRELRKERGYTQEQLAEYADISVDFLGLIEAGRSGMGMQILASIATIFNVTTDYLIFGTTPYKENPKINDMLSALPTEIQKQVEKMLIVFVDSLRISTKKLSKNNNSEKK